MPSELITALNHIDHIILCQELPLKLLTYNQIKMIVTYFWDYPVQIYPQVDLILTHKLNSGQSSIYLEEELQDPFFWDYYVTSESNAARLIDVYRIS
jgi:hypothetical protein